jgi:transposase
MEDQPEQSRRPDTTRDQRRDAQLMRRLGYTHAAISAELNLSLSQVQYALSHTEDPVSRPGRPSKLTEAQVQELKAFMEASKENELMPFGKIPQALGWDVGEYCIRHTLRKLGYRRPAGGRKKSTAAVKRTKGGEETSKETSKETPKETPRETSRVTTIDTPTGTPAGTSQDMSKDTPPNGSGSVEI